MNTQIIYAHADLSRAEVYDLPAAALCDPSNLPSDLLPLWHCLNRKNLPKPTVMFSKKVTAAGLGVAQFCS